MISSLHLNKIIKLVIFFLILIFNVAQATAAEDIWKKQEKQNTEDNEAESEKEITIESPILSDDISKIQIKIDEQSIEDTGESLIGIFDPEKNNFSLNMWVNSDGEEIKKILRRINKLKLSKISEDLLFQVLFTNAYAPKKNLTSELGSIFVEISLPSIQHFLFFLEKLI